MSTNLVDFFDALFDDFGRFSNMMGSSNTFYTSNHPPMNAWLDKESKDITLEFAVAGYTQDNINLSAEGDYLHLEITPEKKDREEYYVLQKGISEAKVHRKFYIPGSRYNLAGVQAATENGLLYIKVPAREEAKPQRIQIEHKT